jgi:large subunit ribosomal protein L20
MARAKKGAASRRQRNRILKAAKGFVGGRRAQLRKAKETLMRGMRYATRDRRVRKRKFRALWITRLNAATRERGLSYSRFIEGLKKADINLDRKILSEIAISDPAGFDAIFAKAKACLASSN